MDKNVRILIVEDEFVTLDLLRDYLEESGYEVSGDAMSTDEAIEILEKGETDFAMLDINIKGDKNGIWIAEQIQKKYKIPFIFLTAFSDSATVKNAAGTHPYGYLVKPFTQADIYTTIEIALTNFNEQRRGHRASEHQPDSHTVLQLTDTIFVKDNLVFKKITIKDIQYIQAYKNYLELYLAGSSQIIRSTLSDFQKTLPEAYFIQTHRSFIVNKRCIDKIGANFLTIGASEIPISRGFKDDVLKHLKFYS